MWVPQHLRTLQASTACYGDILLHFTFTLPGSVFHVNMVQVSIQITISPSEVFD
jgi:hypothetical protein